MGRIVPTTPNISKGTATVVGGGPAGLMAAEVMARGGLEVTVYDHMPSVGRKLLLAGRGGLNITHSEPIADLLKRYGSNADRLEPAIRSFGPRELRAWCASLGEETFVGSSGRVFPASFRATPLLRAWLTRLAELGVTIETRHRWTGWDGSPAQLTFRRDGDHQIQSTSDVTVFALGGASWPRVGSDGGWVTAFREAGIAVAALRPSNFGIRVPWSQHFVDRFAGTPLKNVAVRAGGAATRGDVTITTAGIEGGPVYSHSASIRDSLDRDGRCTVTIDLQPDLSADQLTDRLARGRPKDSTTTLLRRAIGLSPVAVSLLRESTGNHIPVDPVALAALVKRVPIAIEATMPIDRSISSAGGIAMAELDESFMIRRLPGTFAVGEMLDWEAPTGGYLLQASFSTAVAAAAGALHWLGSRSATPPQIGQR